MKSMPIMAIPIEPVSALRGPELAAPPEGGDCLNCQVELKLVSVITDTVVVDTILRDVDEGAGHDPHARRVPLF